MGRMGKKSFSTPTSKDDEELQRRRLEKLIKMFNKKDVSDSRNQELPPYDPLVKSTYTSARPQFLRYQPGRNKDVSDLGCLGGQQELPPYDPGVKSTYTSARPQFLRYRSSRKEDGEDSQEKYQRMQPSGRTSCFKIMILILLAVLSVSTVCISAGHSTKLYSYFNLQDSAELDMPINEIADKLGLSINENSEQSELPISVSVIADELGLSINKDSKEYGLQIKENIEQFNIDGYEAHGLVVFKQFGIMESESTYNFAAHSTVLTSMSGRLALESLNHMEVVMSELKKTKQWVLDDFLAEDKHFGVLDVLATAEDSKDMGAVLFSTSIKSLGSPLLCGVTGVCFCAFALVFKWYKRRTIYVPSVQLVNEYSLAQAVSSSGKKKDSMWNESNIQGNSFYIPSLKVRKGDSASTTNQESIITEETYMESSSYRSITTIEKKVVDKNQQKEIPLRRSQRIQNFKKSDCAHRQDA